MHLTKARGTRWAFTLCLLALSAVSSWAWAGVPSDAPPSWIYDGANLLNPEEITELSTLREKLEQESGARLVVLTLAEAGSESSKSIAVRTLNDWNAGRKSALLLVRLSPRELYIQPGTDLASTLDSSTSSSICSGVIAPKLRSGDRAGAIRAGLEAISARITSASESAPPLAQASSDPQALAVPASAQNSLPAAPSRNSAIPWWVSSFTDAMVWVGGLGTVVLGVLGLSRLFARKCKECGKRMKKSSRITLQPTYSSSGQGMHTFTCGSCGYSFNERYIIAQLVESTSSSSDSSWSSSSSDSSWSSSSSDSSSSSSSSSDGSGGGGSSW